MLTVKIRYKSATSKWRPIADIAADPAKPPTLSLVEAAEGDTFSLLFFPADDTPPAIRVFVGSVIVGSTIQADRALPIDYSAESDADQPPLVCQGRLLADCVGSTELIVRIRYGDLPDWHVLLALPLAVTAGKIAMEQFERLFTELQRDSAAVLFDVHGKTQLGLKAGPALTSAAPVAVLRNLRETIRELDELFHLIHRNPASRLRTTTTREQAFLGQTVSDATIAEATRDPGMLVRLGGHLAFREHLREHARPDYRIAEHETIADFVEYLKAQLGDLRRRIDSEIEERQRRKSWRHQARDPGKPTWWESEDSPRIAELGRYRQELGILHMAVETWAAFPFLLPGRTLSHKPNSTPLFRNHPVYRRVFRVIVSHFLAYQATLDTQSLLTRARSLPVLYEWWCAVRVIRTLTRGLQPLVQDPLHPSIVSTRLAQEGRRFTIEFAPNQALNFVDAKGARVRFRYQPEYLLARAESGTKYGVLDASLRTPDIALEVYPPGRGSHEVPDLIVVLDAKYSSLPQAQKLAEVSMKYAKIGDARTGRVLSRQVWALTPTPPQLFAPREGLQAHCTVDNEAFWSAEFDPGNPVTGAVEARPVGPGGFDPLEALLLKLLGLAGLEYKVEEAAAAPFSEMGEEAVA